MKYLWVLLLISPAWADNLFIEAAGGMTHFYRIHKDNYWYQAPYPYEHSLNSTAWRLGIGYQFSDQWSASVSWLNLGNVGVKARFVTDAQYSRCLDGDHGPQGCGAPTQRFDIKSENQGPEFALRRDFKNTYLRGGVFLWMFDFHMKGEAADGTPFDNNSDSFSGWRLAPFVGAGVKYKSLFAEINYYHGLGGKGGFPIAKQAVVPMVGFRWEL